MTGIVSVCALIVSALAFCMSIVTVLLGLRQKKIDNLISVQQFLHQGDLSEARRSIREQECEITLKNPAVRRVCSSFDFAGTLVRNSAVNRTLFLQYWCLPLRALELPFKGLANEQTGHDISVKEYYRDFWWLMEQAKKYRLPRQLDVHETGHDR